jgi:hypothetical protein
VISVGIDDAVFRLNPDYTSILVAVVRFRNRTLDAFLSKHVSERLRALYTELENRVCLPLIVRCAIDSARVHRPVDFLTQLVVQISGDLATRIVVDDLQRIGPEHELRIANGTETMRDYSSGDVTGTTAVGDLIYLDVLGNRVVRYDLERQETGAATPSASTEAMLFSLPAPARYLLPRVIEAGMLIHNSIMRSDAGLAQMMILDSRTPRCRFGIVNDPLDADSAARFEFIVAPVSSIHRART